MFVRLPVEYGVLEYDVDIIEASGTLQKTSPNSKNLFSLFPRKTKRKSIANLLLLDKGLKKIESKP